MTRHVDLEPYTPARFVRDWQTAESLEGLAEKLQAPAVQLADRAARYRARGVGLKELRSRYPNLKAFTGAPDWAPLARAAVDVLESAVDRGANWTPPGTDEPCYQRPGGDGPCLNCGNQIFRHWGGTEYRCHERKDP